MDRSAWERLGDELRALDRWGDFGAGKTRTTSTGLHPASIMFNGGVPLEHFPVYVPALLRALDELTGSGELETVVRVVTKKGLKGVTGKLVDLFTREDLVHEHNLLWAAGNAIYHIAPRDYLNECLRICRNRRLGYSRQRLIVHLSRFKKSEEVFQTLLSLLEDESVRGAALEALKRYGDVRALPAIQRTPVRGGDEGVYEAHQKMMALKKLSEKLV